MYLIFVVFECCNFISYYVSTNSSLRFGNLTDLQKCINTNKFNPLIYINLYKTTLNKYVLHINLCSISNLSVIHF